MFSSPTAFITKCPPVSPASGEKGKKAEGCSSTFCGPRPNNAHVRSTLEVGEAARGCKVGGAHSVHFQPTIFSAYKGFTGRDITPSVHGPASPRPEHRTKREQVSRTEAPTSPAHRRAPGPHGGWNTFPTKPLLGLRAVSTLRTPTSKLPGTVTGETDSQETFTHSFQNSMAVRRRVTCLHPGKQPCGQRPGGGSQRP